MAHLKTRIIRQTGYFLNSCVISFLSGAFSEKINDRYFRVIFFYEWKLGQNPVEPTDKIEVAFGDKTVIERREKHWFPKFRSGDESLRNESHKPPNSSGSRPL